MSVHVKMILHVNQELYVNMMQVNNVTSPKQPVGMVNARLRFLLYVSLIVVYSTARDLSVSWFQCTPRRTIKIVSSSEILTNMDHTTIPK